MNVSEHIKKAISKFKLSPLDAEILLSLAAKLSKEKLLAHPEKQIAKPLADKYLEFAKRRAAGEPISYISGKKEFFGLDFNVNKNVLIPRPETELLVEAAIERICDPKSKIPDAVIDVGTGSGNIIISIIKNIPKKIISEISFFAVDICPLALSVSKINSMRHNVDKHIRFIQSDLLNFFLKKSFSKKKNVLIIANLPYVSCAQYKKNFNNLKNEPKTALLSRQKGMHHYRALVKQMKILYSGDRQLFAAIEISPEQKKEISLILRQNIPDSKVTSLKDLAGKWRIVRVETGDRT